MELSLSSLEPLFNFVEHGLGIGLAGITFLAAAYVRRQQVITTE